VVGGGGFVLFFCWGCGLVCVVLLFYFTNPTPHRKRPPKPPHTTRGGLGVWFVFFLVLVWGSRRRRGVWMGGEGGAGGGGGGGGVGGGGGGGGGRGGWGVGGILSEK